MSDTYLGFPGNHTGKTFDKALEFFASGSTLTNATASAAIHIGAGLVDADLVVDLETVTIAASASSGLTLQFCDDPNFGSNVVSGATVSFTGGQTGRVVFPFRNDPAGKPLSYVRLMPQVSTALKLGAFAAKK